LYLGRQERTNVFRNLYHGVYKLVVLASNEAKIARYMEVPTFADTDFVLSEIAGKLNDEVFAL